MMSAAQSPSARQMEGMVYRAREHNVTRSLDLPASFRDLSVLLAVSLLFFASSSQAAPLAAEPDWQYQHPAAGSGLGHAVVSVDFDGDGYSDIAVSAPDAGADREGEVNLFLGSAGGLGASATWSEVGGQSQRRFGWTMAGLIDGNGDGYGEVVVGSEAGQPGVLLSGSSSGLPGDWTTTVCEVGGRVSRAGALVIT